MALYQQTDQHIPCDSPVESSCLHGNQSRSFPTQNLPSDVRRIIISYLGIYDIETRRQLRMISNLARLLPDLLSQPPPPSGLNMQRHSILPLRYPRKISFKSFIFIAKTGFFCLCLYAILSLFKMLLGALFIELYDLLWDMWNGVETYSPNGLDQLGRSTMKSSRMEREKLTEHTHLEF